MLRSKRQRTEKKKKPRREAIAGGDKAPRELVMQSRGLN